jgi:hypothetical protein
VGGGAIRAARVPLPHELSPNPSPRLRPPSIHPPPRQGLSVNGVLDVAITINSGAAGPVEWRMGGHPGVAEAQIPGSVTLTLDADQAGVRLGRGQGGCLGVD